MIIQQIESHIVPALVAPIRLPNYAIGIFNNALTKSAIKKALKKELITVDGTIATSATFISGGESIQLSLASAGPKKRLILPLDVLYEDDHLAVIHKPAGILVSGNSFKTIANALSQNLKNSTLADATIPQPVHRLDYATTGILLVGKTSSSIRVLNKLFENKEISKTYFAITIGKMEKSGHIISDIDDKYAKSFYQVCETVTSNRFDALNLVKLVPETGRRHQLRKHLSSIGNPILGDKDYGIDQLILNGKGLYLHAFSLEFQHPFTGKKVNFKDDLPKRFGKIFPSQVSSS